MNDREFHTVRGYELLKQNKKLLTSSMEDYLEMIYRNSLSEGFMRMNTLAGLLNVRASSASKMVQKLGELGFMKYEKYGILKLTPKGESIGKYLLTRHNVIETFLKTIGVTENLLGETELIEHNISIETLKNINLLNKFLSRHPEVLVWFEEYKTLHAGEEEFEGMV